MIEAVFLISPIVDDKLSKIDPQGLAYWEEKWVGYNQSFFMTMATDYQKQQQDTKLYPIRNAINSIKDFPGCVIFTSEFDCMRRESEALKKVLENKKKLLDYHDMPGVGHLYYYDCENPESYWFFKDYAAAFKKYVQKNDKLEQITASFKR